jgi:carboxypeptidase Taq
MNEHLLARMQELRDLGGVIGLASWDQETYLPKKAEGGRAAQLGTLQSIHHERLVDPKLGDWLADAKPADDDERAMVRLLTRERDRAVKIPNRLVKALAEAQSHALSAWREAREDKDFSVFQPHVQTLLTLRREMADAWGHDGERYDALLENYEPGMRVKRLSPVLKGLREKLVPLVTAIDARPSPKRIFAGKVFDTEAQWKFTMHLLEVMGFDLEAGRQDRSTHPFTGGTGLFDVRLTTRLFPDLPLSSVFSTIHEAGHGLYEQGFDPKHERTPLAQAPSMGLHESQSRLWENVIGRSRAFWSHFYPRYQQLFSSHLAGVTLDEFMQEVNRVERSFIRVEADEVTYNLHIVLRTELELELIRGNLQAADLEAAWNEKTKELLGLEVKSVTQGVLQDIHWAYGEFGYFPTYALGNLYAASLWKAMNRDITGLDESIRHGELSPVRNWLREKVHREGFRLDAEALVTRVTGAGLRDDDFVAYLKEKYGPTS